MKERQLVTKSDGKDVWPALKLFKKKGMKHLNAEQKKIIGRFRLRLYRVIRLTDTDEKEVEKYKTHNRDLNTFR